MAGSGRGNNILRVEAEGDSAQGRAVAPPQVPVDVSSIRAEDARHSRNSGRKSKGSRRGRSAAPKRSLRVASKRRAKDERNLLGPSLSSDSDGSLASATEAAPFNQGGSGPQAPRKVGKAIYQAVDVEMEELEAKSNAQQGSDEADEDNYDEELVTGGAGFGISPVPPPPRSAVTLNKQFLQRLGWKARPKRPKHQKEETPSQTFTMSVGLVGEKNTCSKRVQWPGIDVSAGYHRLNDFMCKCFDTEAAMLWQWSILSHSAVVKVSFQNTAKPLKGPRRCCRVRFGEHFECVFQNSNSCGFPKTATNLSPEK